MGKLRLWQMLLLSAIALAALLAVLIVLLPAIVWKVLGWVLLGLLGLVVLLLATPVTVRLRLQNGQFTAHVRVLFVRLRVFPLPQWLTKEKPQKPKKEKEPPKAEAKEALSKKKRGTGDTIALAKRLAKAGWAAAKRFMRHLRIGGVRLVLPVHAGDAADTARRCGQIQTAIGTLRALADGRVHLKFKAIQIIPDFADQYSQELYLNVYLRLLPGILFPVGFAFLKTFMQSRRPYSKKAYRQAIEEKRRAREAAVKARAAAGQNGSNAA